MAVVAVGTDPMGEDGIGLRQGGILGAVPVVLSVAAVLGVVFEGAAPVVVSSGRDLRGCVEAGF